MPVIRNVETLLPDHEPEKVSETATVSPSPAAGEPG